jgi:RNA polymerase sigma-32 factor
MWWIKAAMQEYILRSWSLVKMGTTANQKKVFFNLRKAKSKISILDEGDMRPDHPDQETTLAASEEFDNRRKTLSDVLGVLNERERRIFEGRRLAEDPSTLAELAYEFGISRERARQIEMSSFEKVQNAVKHRVAAMGTPAPLQVR